jgi:transposase
VGHGDFRLLFMDESGFELDFPIHACWMKRGCQTRLPATPQRKQASYLVAAYDWQSDQLIALRQDRLNQHTMIVFLEHLTQQVFPNDSLVIVMDNASFHKSNALRAFLALIEHRVHVEWLPTYSPDLNLIERVWRHLKQLVCANHLYPNIDRLFDALFCAISLQNDPAHTHRLLFSKNFL